MSDRGVSFQNTRLQRIYQKEVSRFLTQDYNDYVR